MSNEEVDIFADANDIEVSDEELNKVSTLTQELLEQNQKKEELEAQLKQINDRIYILETREIPDAMDEIGMSDFTLSTGQKIQVENIFRANIPKDRQEEAFQWLRDNGHGSLIKRNVTVKFGKGQDNEAGDVVSTLRERGLEPEDKSEVHWKTLTSFCKEQVEKGEDIPQDALGLFIGRKAKVKA